MTRPGIGRRMRRRSLVPVVALLLTQIALQIATNAATSQPPDWSRSWLWLGWPLIGILAAVTVAIEVRRQRVGGPDGASSDSAAVDLSGLEAALAEAVARQWSDEVAVRGFSRSQRMVLRWSTGRRQVSPPAAAIFGPGAGRGRRRGTADSLVDDFLALPKRQLVLLGRPGAGKTGMAVLLTLDLLARRAADPAVPAPVLLPLASWQPEREHLHAWIARRLGEDYPALANIQRYGPDAAARLVQRGRVLPILDGMDELPAAIRPAALAAISRTVGEPYPLVLTCRSEEYETAVRTGGTVPAVAAVVEIEPVSRTAVVAYLSSARVTGDRHWDPVVVHLRQHPDGALAQAVTTPLMTALVRDAYADPTSDPAELTDTARFPDRGAVERHLLNAFVPAAYAPIAAPGAGHTSPLRRPPRPRYDPHRAQRWLAFLASQMHRQGTYELRWWRLHEALPRRTHTYLAGLVVGALAALTTALTVWLTVRPAVGAAMAGPAALGVGVVAAVVMGLITVRAGAAPTGTCRVNVALRGRFRHLGRALATGLAQGVIAGTGIGFIAEITLVALGPSSVAAVLGLVVCLVLGTVAGLAFGLTAWLNMPAESLRVTSPAVVLREDRAAVVVRVLVVAAGFGMTAGLIAAAMTGPALAVVDGAGGALLGLVVGLARGLGAWGWYQLARCWLALRGRVPWRLSAFLADAHRRGLLRRTGATYEFRHARLQDRLATVPFVPGEDAPPSPVSAADADGAAGTRQPSRWGTRRRLAAGALAALMAGPVLGVAVPLVLVAQAHCGELPIAGGLSGEQHSAVDGDCYGIGDGSVPFAAADRRSVAVQRAIAAMNNRNETVPHLTLVYFGDLSTTAGPRTGWKELAGVAALQARQGTSDALALRVLIANAGPNMRYARAVAARIAALAATDPTVVGVVGVPVTRHETVSAVSLLSAVGLPVVTTTATGDELQTVAPTTFRMVPSNADLATAAAAILRGAPVEGGGPRIAVVYSHDDSYSTGLAADFVQAVGGRPETLDYDSAAGDLAVAALGRRICGGPQAVFFTGRSRELAAFLRGAAECPQPPRILVGDDISYLAGGHPAAPITLRFDYLSFESTDGVPSTCERDPYRFLREVSPDGCDADRDLRDGHVGYAFDAALMVTAAARRCAAAGVPVTRHGVVEGMARLRDVAGATGTIMFGADRVVHRTVVINRMTPGGGGPQRVPG